ncbi:nitroreductase family protein [Marinoscillum sp. MHG1-6]|uniref:nitroreductase family protein n=1 Tax=Marinoscillum sp. MHG1-6 TaxID=2959627 RepID=UPI0021573F40|nr:nitroreductase family protein [Marinoscillum sp. MHG1-6]
MNKTAKTTYKINDLIASRWSPRSFTGESISDEDLFSLFEAARWAPSAMNEQPWRFLYAKRGEAAFDKMVAALKPGNQPWAPNASALIVTLVKKTFERNGAPNAAASHDLGLAVGNLTIQATELGYALHQMGGFEHHLIIDYFNIPEDYEPVTIIAVGKAGSPEQLEGALRDRELATRNRRPLEEIVFHETFNG